MIRRMLSLRSVAASAHMHVFICLGCSLVCGCTYSSFHLCNCTQNIRSGRYFGNHKKIMYNVHTCERASARESDGFVGMCVCVFRHACLSRCEGLYVNTIRACPQCSGSGRLMGGWMGGLSLGGSRRRSRRRTDQVCFRVFARICWSIAIGRRCCPDP